VCATQRSGERRRIGHHREKRVEHVLRHGRARHLCCNGVMLPLCSSRRSARGLLWAYGWARWRACHSE
jgi:hypothetical protein